MKVETRAFQGRTRSTCSRFVYFILSLSSFGRFSRWCDAYWYIFDKASALGAPQETACSAACSFFSSLSGFHLALALGLHVHVHVHVHVRLKSSSTLERTTNVGWRLLLLKTMDYGLKKSIRRRRRRRTTTTASCQQALETSAHLQREEQAI